MDPLDDLCSKDGWIITTNVNGKTKVASCNPDETNAFHKTRDNWVTLREDIQLTEDQESENLGSEKVFKPPFQQVGTKYNQKRLGFYLIRDLLNLKKSSGLTQAFLADNILLKKVIVCARITSYQQKNNFYRLVLDDGTSSILCMVKIQDDIQVQESQCEDERETSFDGSDAVSKNSSVLWAIQKLTLHRKKLIEESSTKFDPTSLGRPVRVMGYLYEYCGKNFIFAYNFNWISEKYLVNFLCNIIQLYEYKENYMRE